MNSNLPTRLQHLVLSARGLDEPRFDAKMGIANWPENLVNDVKQLIQAIQTSGNDVELRACADILNLSEQPNVPDGLLRMLSHAVFDNPNTPLREH